MLRFLFFFILGIVLTRNFWLGLLIALALTFFSSSKKTPPASRQKNSARTENRRVDSAVLGTDLNVSQYITRALFAVIGTVAKAKGVVTRDDIALANEAMRRLQLDETLKVQAREFFTLGKNGALDLQTLLGEVRRFFRNAEDVRRMFFEASLEFALNDGEISGGEQQILRFIALQVGISEDEFQSIMRRYTSAHNFSGSRSSQQSHTQENAHTQGKSAGADALQAACDILGVSAGADYDTVKKAYRSLMNQYHPDKLAGKDLPAGLMEMAKEKTQEILAAYRYICTQKGWKS